MIYFMQPVNGGPVKIGFTDNIEARHKSLEKHYGVPLALLATLPGDRDTENEIHARFAHLRFSRCGAKGRHPEQFIPAVDLMEFIGRPLLASANPDAVEAMTADPSSNQLKNIFVMRGTDEWKTWLDELAGANSAPITVTIEQALKDFAEKLKVRKPPRRVP